ncbi:MAG: hypothetical protein HFJ40_04260 [Clostridia bacterium]|nr:hypothetical protein [Clostridia bacterium]
MENKIKNKIIALSGQPVTGKGTTVKSLIEKLKEKGYDDENIHVISTGNEFRNYFNVISEFVKNFDNNEMPEKVLQNAYLKNISENKEYRRILIDTITQLKQNKVNINNLNIEQANNLKEFKGLRKIVDTLIDTNIEQKGKIINQEERPDEIWIIDSRLAFHNIPEAFSVRLTSTPDIAAKRLFNDKNRGQEDNNYISIIEAKEAREKRRIGEQERYKKRYDVDLENEDNYDLIIDTSYATIEDTSDTILTCLDCYVKDKPFSQKWTSPKTLLPLQTGRDTGYGFMELAKEIQKNGYMPSEAIEIIEAGGRSYIIEGHHRNFCSAYIGKTLVPYKVIGKDDNKISWGNTANYRANGLRRIYLWDHESIFEHNTDEKFSYDDIYPGIYEELQKEEENQR